MDAVWLRACEGVVYSSVMLCGVHQDLFSGERKRIRHFLLPLIE